MSIIRKGFLLGCICVAVSLSSACTHRGKVTSVSLGDSLLVELPLPDVPKRITDPKERADYILQHFWGQMDFSDTALIHNEKFLEQNFVNFLSFFPHATPEVLPKAIGKLLKGCKKDKQAFDIVTDIAEKYLSEPDSPMRNEDYYIVFLEKLLSMPDFEEEQLLRPRTQLERVMKNRPGASATNFRFTTREGQQESLSNVQADLLLLIFYDPECGHCTDILESLATSEIINTLISQGALCVLAVYTEGNRTLWNEKKGTMPKDWTVAIDESNIVDKALYDLPAMPTIYLLDSHKTVLLKDPTPAALEDNLFQVLSSTLME